MSNAVRTTKEGEKQNTILSKKLISNELSCKLLSWNVWSMLDDKKLRCVLQILNDQNISLACICETWFDGQKGRFTKTIKDAGYDLIHANKEDQRGGGVAILFSQSLKIKPVEASSTKFMSFEYSYCIYQSGRTKILVICVYRQQEIACKIFCEGFDGFLESTLQRT